MPRSPSRFPGTEPENEAELATGPQRRPVDDERDCAVRETAGVWFPRCRLPPAVRGLVLYAPRTGAARA